MPECAFGHTLAGPKALLDTLGNEPKSAFGLVAESRYFGRWTDGPSVSADVPLLLDAAMWNV